MVPNIDSPYQPTAELNLTEHAIEVIEILTRIYKVKVSMSFKSTGEKGLWTIKAMDKPFRHEEFAKAVGLMATFVYSAHTNESNGLQP